MIKCLIFYGSTQNIQNEELTEISNEFTHFYSSDVSIDLTNKMGHLKPIQLENLENDLSPLKLTRETKTQKHFSNFMYSRLPLVRPPLVRPLDGLVGHLRDDSRTVEHRDKL